MKNCRPAATPLNPGFQHKCSSNNCKMVDANKYQSLVGELMYLGLLSRPDILHSVCKLAQFNKEPHGEHETGLKHILRYLNFTKDLKLNYSKNNEPIHGYADADWAGDPTDRKSFTGYVFLLAGGAISWESKKQRSVALSSTEAEYVSLSMATKEAIFLRRLLQEIYVGKDEAISLFGDNLSAQQLAKNPVYHARSKHIDIRYHFVREVIQSKQIELNYFPTNDMTADILTKNLGTQKHNLLVKKMRLF